MLCRALLAALAISYLICVLFLSGIQREDLDVSLLKKLQRYNVNLDDLTDKKLRRECLVSADNNSSIDQNEGDASLDTNTTATEPLTTVEVTVEPTTNYFGTLDTTELETVIKFLESKKLSQKTMSPEYEDKKDLKSNIKKKIKEYIVERMISETNANLKKNGGSEIEITKGSPSVEGLVKFWETYMKSLQNNVSEDKKDIKPIPSKAALENISNITQINTTVNGNNKDAENIGKILDEYLSKKHLLSNQNDLQTETSIKQPPLPQVDKLLNKSHEIEQQFASSLAAINKLNENIASLQNNLKSGKYLSTLKPIEQGEEHEFIMKKDSLNLKQTVPITPTSKSEVKPTQNKVVEDVLWRKSINIAEALKLGQDVGSVQNKTYSSKVKKIVPNNDKEDLDNDSDYLENDQVAFIEPVRNQTVPEQRKIGYITHDELPRLRQIKDINSGEKTTFALNPNNPQSSESGEEKESSNYQMFKNSKAPMFQSDHLHYADKIKVSQNYMYEKRKENQAYGSTALDSSQNKQDLIGFGYNKYNAPIEDNLKYNKESNVSDLKGEIEQYTPETLILPALKNYSNGRGPTNLVTNEIHTRQPDFTPYKPQKQYMKHGLDKIPEDLIAKIELIAKATKKRVENAPDTSNVQMTSNLDQQDTKSYVPVPFIDHTKIIDEIILPIEQNQNTVYTKETKSEDFKTVKPTSAEENKDFKTLSQDMIKKIAESVKEIVLKDLRNITSTAATITSPHIETTTEKSTSTQLTTNSSTTSTTISTITMLSSTTTLSSTTVTSTTSTSTTAADNTTTMTSNAIANTTDVAPPEQKLDLNRVQAATQAIEKFLQLFEQLQSVQAKKPSSEVVTRHKNQNVPLILIPPPLPPPPFAIKTRPDIIPMIVDRYAPPTLTHQREEIGVLSPAEKGSKPNIKHFHGEPVMIQTNANEIRPIGIPMMKPEALNLNIVLTTQHPYWSKSERDRWNFMKKYGRNPEKNADIQFMKQNMNEYSNVNTNKPDKSETTQKPIIETTEHKINNHTDDKFDETTRLNLLKEIELYHQKHGIQYNKFGEPINENDFDNNKVKTNGYLNQNNYNLEKGTADKQYLNPIYYSEYNNHNNSNHYINEGYQNREREYEYTNKKYEYSGKFNKEGDTIKLPEVDLGPISSHSQVDDENKFVHTNIFDYADSVHSIGNDRLQTYESKPKDHSQTKNKENVYYMSHAAHNYDHNLPKNQYNESPYLKPSIDNYGSPTFIKNRDKYYNNHNVYSDPIMTSQNKDMEYSIDGLASRHVNKYIGYPKYITSSKPKYQHYANEYKNFYLVDQMKAKINNLEKYLDNPHQMELVRIESKNRANSHENFKHSDFNRMINFNKVASSQSTRKQIERPRFKLGNGDRYLSSPSEEESPLEFKTRHEIKGSRGPKPIHKLDFKYKIGKDVVYDQDEVSAWYNKNTDTGNDRHMEMITAMIGHRDRPKSSSDVETERERHSQYRPQLESSDSDIKNQRPQGDSMERQYRVPLDQKQYPNIDVRGFHEKLEGSDSWPESPSDCGTDEHCILSRQQTPLSGSKKGKYDDTHFKNFLKTQQKVNRMLERILATKGVQSGEVLR